MGRRFDTVGSAEGIVEIRRPRREPHTFRTHLSSLHELLITVGFGTIVTRYSKL